MTKLLSDLTAKLADDADDTTGEYGPQILEAVQGAQRFCEASSYYFNETRDVTFVTVAGQQWYGAAANANIPTLVRIQAAYREDVSGISLPIRRETPETLELLADSSGATGEPYCWTYFNQQIRLYAIPGTTVYTIRLQLGPYRLTELAIPTDTNAWLNEAYDLIKARAKYILAKDTLMDANMAVEALNDWRDQDDRLTLETSKRSGSGFIRPTRF